MCLFLLLLRNGLYTLFQIQGIFSLRLHGLDTWCSQGVALNATQISNKTIKLLMCSIKNFLKEALNDLASACFYFVLNLRKSFRLVFL